MAETPEGAKAGTRLPDSYPAANQWDSVLTVGPSDATTTGQSLVDVTGLVANVLHGSVYEFDCLLSTVASADTTGMQVGLHASQTPVSVQALVNGNTTTVTVSGAAIVAVDAGTSAFNTTSAGNGIIRIRGTIKTHATLDGTFSIQHLKVTSGTSTVKAGSTLKLRKVA